MEIIDLLSFAEDYRGRRTKCSSEGYEDCVVPQEFSFEECSPQEILLKRFLSADKTDFMLRCFNINNTTSDGQPILSKSHYTEIGSATWSNLANSYPEYHNYENYMEIIKGNNYWFAINPDLINIHYKELTEEGVFELQVLSPQGIYGYIY